jgi:hypothetical protein
MRDVTRLLSNYRECSRTIWNTYFGVLEDWCRLESIYERVRQSLFESLVLAQLKEDQNASTEESPILWVIPHASMPVRIKRASKDGNTYWDQEPDLRAGESDISLKFVDYYDFFQGPVRDYRFYRCIVLKFPRRSEYEGREALVDVADARVFYEG